MASKIYFTFIVIYTAQCHEIQSCQSHHPQHWVRYNAISAHNVCFECLLQVLLLLHHLLIYIYIFTFIVLCLIVSSTVCSTFHIQKLHFEIEVPGSMWICGSVTAPRLTKIDPIGCSTILDFG